MADPIDTVIVRGQHEFSLQDVPNPVKIEINDDRILSKLKKYKNTYYKLHM